MKYRKAKKIWTKAEAFICVGYPDVPGKIWGKDVIARAEEVYDIGVGRKRKTHKIFLRGLKLVDILKKGSDEWKTEWPALKQNILDHWLPEPLNQEERDWAEHLLSGEAFKVEDLVYHLEYYCDRWCGWRVLVMDNLFRKRGGGR